jgi:hypothetical protein
MEHHNLLNHTNSFTTKMPRHEVKTDLLPAINFQWPFGFSPWCLGALVVNHGLKLRLHDSHDGRDLSSPLFRFGLKLFAPALGELVILRAAIIFRGNNDPGLTRNTPLLICSMRRAMP